MVWNNRNVFILSPEDASWRPSPQGGHVTWRLQGELFSCLFWILTLLGISWPVAQYLQSVTPSPWSSPVPSSHSLLLHEVSLHPPVSPSPWSPSVFLCLFLFCFLKEKAPLDSVPILIQDLLMWVLNYIDWNDIFFPNRIYSGVLDEDISGEQDSIPWVLKGRSRVCSGAHLRREGGLVLTAIITAQGQAEQAVAVGLAIEWAVKVFCRQVHTVV